MNLKEFVRDVLVELDGAVDEANESTKRAVNFRQGVEARTIEFDIAVSADSSLKGAAKAGVKVLQVFEVGGDVTKETASSTVSRIKFGLEIGVHTRTELARMEAEASNSTGIVNPHLPDFGGGF